MTLQDRLQELVTDHDSEAAVTLAKAAMKNEELTDVTVDADSVTVETRRFRGVHRWWTEEGRIVIDERGQYTCTCEEVDLSFSTRRMVPAAHDRAIERLRERFDPGPGRDSDPANPEAEGDETASTDHGSDSVTAATSNPGSVDESVRDTTPGSEASSPDSRTAVADGGTSTAPDDSRGTWWSRFVQWITTRFR